MAGFAILLTLAAPTLALRLGSTDHSTLAQSQTARRAFDAISTGFGPGANGRFLVAVEGTALTTTNSWR